jgi:hypothetical protein
MAEWLIDRPLDPRAFPTVRHRHANGTLDAVRDRTPVTIRELGSQPVDRWTYACACGELWTLERRRS